MKRSTVSLLATVASFAVQTKLFIMLVLGEVESTFVSMALFWVASVATIALSLATNALLRREGRGVPVRVHRRRL